ncbi:Serine/threonine-protein phosphatase 2A activator, partial [Trichinella sp. T8]
LMFLLCLWKVGYFDDTSTAVLVLRIFDAYIKLCRRLQMTYKLEPAGSHAGPFAEHSNGLYSLCTVPNWRNINSGLLRMYEEEVLKKFPVAQHFLFGILLSVEPAGSSCTTLDMSEAVKLQPDDDDFIRRA